MSDTQTPNLALEYLDSAQAQPEVKINDAWNKIDAYAGRVHSDSGGISGMIFEIEGDSPGIEGITKLVFTGTAVASLTQAGDVGTITLNAGSGAPAGTAGELQYNDAGAFGAIAAGTVGQVLTANATGAPSFQTASSGGGSPGGPTNAIQWNNSGAFAGGGVGAVGSLYSIFSFTPGSGGAAVMTLANNYYGGQVILSVVAGVSLMSFQDGYGHASNLRSTGSPLRTFFIDNTGSPIGFYNGNTEWWSVTGAPTTGSNTATFAATNSPGSGGAVQAWIPITMNGGTQGWIPVFN
jgi:hypothetical protein